MKKFQKTVDNLLLFSYIYTKGIKGIQMENNNLESTLLLVNLMMSVDRAFDELELLLEDEPYFIDDEDADEFFEVATEFDYMKEAFTIWRNRYVKDHYVDLLEIDTIANNLDFIRHYIESINKLF
ncbi:MAG: hypothetical protein ACW98D_21945 [Promethearchaeota archaeon]